MLCKFINEQKVEAFKGGFIVLDNKIYTNPTEETLRKAGYKNLAIVTEPEYNPDTQYIVTTYEDGEDYITPVFKVANYIEITEDVSEDEGEETTIEDEVEGE